MAPRGDRDTADVTLAKHQILMLDQPRPDACHEFGIVENGRRFPAEIGGPQREA